MVAKFMELQLEKLAESDRVKEGANLTDDEVAAIGWFVPRLWAKVLPEGVKPLMVIALVSTLTMGIVGIGYFIVLYLIQGFPISELFAGNIADTIAHFGRLSLISALLWGPVMLLSVMGLVRRWKKAVW